MTTIDQNTRIIDLTVGQLMSLLKNAAPETAPQVENPKRYVYGISGIAQIFNCSMTTANRIKKSGRINQAIKQQGRIIVIDVDKAIELFNQSKNI